MTSNGPDELEVQSVETPHGAVPTLAGLEQVVNYIMGQVTPLGQAIKDIQDNISSVQEQVSQMNDQILQIGDHLGEHLSLLAQLNSNISEALEMVRSGQVTGLEEQQATLVELQTILAKLLVQFQTLPLQSQSSGK